MILGVPMLKWGYVRTKKEEPVRQLVKGQLPISSQRVIELTQTMYQLRFQLQNNPDVQHVLLKMDTEQQMLYDLLLTGCPNVEVRKRCI